jgi:predicted dehydrogenase
MSPAGQGAPPRIGVIGYAFMGAAHAQAWRNAPRFFDLTRAWATERTG